MKNVAKLNELLEYGYSVASENSDITKNKWASSMPSTYASIHSY